MYHMKTRPGYFGQEKNKEVCRPDFWIFLKHHIDSKFELTAYGKYMH